MLRSSRNSAVWPLLLGLLLGPLLASSVKAQQSHRKPSHLSTRVWDRGLGQNLSKQISKRKRKRFSHVVVPHSVLAKEDLQAVKCHVTDVVYTSAQLQRDLAGLKGPGIALSKIEVGQYQRGFPLFRLDLLAKPYPGDPPPQRILITARVHGDEPAGTKAAVEFAKWAVKNKTVRRRFDITVIPMINPTNRHNVSGKNQNRCFMDGRWTPLTSALRDNLTRDVARRGKYKLAIDLHGDWIGTFLTASQDYGKLGRRILAPFGSPILADTKTGKIDGRPYKFNGLGDAFTNTPGTFKQLTSDAKIADVSYTAEYDRRLPPNKQVSSLLKLIRSAMFNTAKYSK